MSRLPLRFALRYLFARKSHQVINVISGISVAGMAVGTAALVVILSVFNGFHDLVDQSLSDTGPDILVSPARGKVFVPEGEGFDWAYDRPEALSIHCVLEDQAFVDYGGVQSVARVKGVDAVFEEETALRDRVTDGEFVLHRGDRSCAVIASELARNLKASARFSTPLEVYYPDRSVRFSPTNPASSLRRVRTVLSGSVGLPETEGSLVILPLETARELFGYEDQVSAVEIRLAEDVSPRAAARFQSDLAEKLGPDFQVLDRYQQNRSLYRMMRYEKLAIFLLLILITLIIALNIYSSLTMLIIEKEDDIAILRSLGATEETVRKIFRLEGWLISLLGMGIGLVAGVVLVLLQQKFGLIRMAGNYIVSAYPVVLKISDLVLSAAGVALIGYLIACIPARKAI